jgi:NAD(P)-dependent dehydrogenase (short-subunit alcohol dehydrogenase family)
MRVVVTGAAGMIGRKLAERLVRDGALGAEPISELTLVDLVGGETSGVEILPTDPMELQFQFAEDVSASLSSNDIQLTNLTTNTVINPSFIVLSDYNHSTNVATFIFSPAYFNGILPDGDYEAVINAADVTDAVGNPIDIESKKKDSVRIATALYNDLVLKNAKVPANSKLLQTVNENKLVHH